jgi:hypothetical protein
MRPQRLRFLTIALAASVGVAACVDRSPSVMAPEPAANVAEGTDSAGTTLLACSGRLAGVEFGTIGPLGGLLSVNGHSISIPAGAVLVPTPFTLMVPDTDIAEVEIQAADLAHYVFESPVTITLSYAGCSAPDVSSLTAWHIDPDSRQLLEDMGGTVDTVAKTVTFTTGHLSGYAIAD